MPPMSVGSTLKPSKCSTILTTGYRLPTRVSASSGGTPPLSRHKLKRRKNRPVKPNPPSKLYHLCNGCMKYADVHGFPPTFLQVGTQEILLYCLVSPALTRTLFVPTPAQPSQATLFVGWQRLQLQSLAG